MKNRSVWPLLAIAVIGLAGPLVAKEVYKETWFIPSVTAGLPHPVNLNMDLRIPQIWSVGAGFGTLSYTFPNLINGAPLQTGILNFEVRGRWHPFKGAFFLGAAFGRQRLSLQAEDSFLVGAVSVPTKIAMTQWSTYITPHIGWMWILNSRLTFGFEIGAQLPVSPSTAVSVSVTDASVAELLEEVQDTAEYQSLQNEVNEKANQVGRHALPFITLLRFGYAF